MAVLKKYSPLLNLGKAKVFIDDNSSDSPYFNVTELERTLTGGKNAFLFEGSSFFKKGSKVRFEALDVNGNPLYIEPGRQGDKTFREGNSIVMAIHVYDDTPIGVGTLRILAELETYIDNRGVERKIPEQFRGVHNVRWSQKFKINPKIPNKTQVRFFKRPSFSVTEIEKPLLVKTEMTLNKSGSVSGIAEVPNTGSNFSTWTAPSQYRIKLEEGNKFTQSMEENTTLQIPSLGYSSSVLEVINADEMLVRKPYLINNIVHEFQPVSYSLEFESVEDAVVTGSNVTASYAEIRLENLKTFTGDVARIKIFRKSRNDLGDFQVVQENKLDATELLRDFSVENRTVINYGKLRRENIVSEEGDVYYTTSSGVEIHNDKLINSLEVKGNHSVESAGTIGEFQIVSGSEYSFSYNARYSGSGQSVNTDTLRFLIVTSSNNTTNALVTSQSIDLLSGSIDRDPTGLGNIQRVQKNFFAETTGKCQIRVEANTDSTTGRFLFSRLSLKNAEESSYSPDEYTAIVDIPRKNPTEQFDFRVEFYDINNNFIPIKVVQSVPFTKGNQAIGLEASINVKNSGIADAGDILSVEGGVVQIASTNIQSSTIAGLGDPTNFSQELAAATASLQAATQSLELQTQNLQIATASLGADITASNQASAESASLAIIGNTDAVLSASLSASAAQSNAETFATTAANNATLSGSLSASIAITGNENAVLSGSSFATIAGDNSVLSGSAFASDAVTSGSEFAANAALSASASGSVDPSTGLITKAVAPSSDGLYLGASNLGFYESGQWRTYMDDDGQFFLTGSDSNNYLRWTGTTLEIGGAIVLTNGSPGVDLTPLNDFTSSQDSINSNLNAATSSYLNTSTNFDFGGNGFTLDTVSLSGGGLYLGSDKLGYYDGGAWKTYMDNNGQFFLGGTSGNLTWDGTNLLINGTVTASAGFIGTPTTGFNIEANYIGNGKTSLSGSNDGIYIGTDGIALGADNVFKVTDSGNITATNASITGSINAGNGQIAGWNLDGNKLVSANESMSLDSANEKITITDRLSIRTGGLSATSAGSVTVTVPAHTFNSQTYQLPEAYDTTQNADSNGSGTVSFTSTGTYSVQFTNQFDVSNVFSVPTGWSGMFQYKTVLQFRTAASGGGSLIGEVILAEQGNFPYASSGYQRDLDTYTLQQYITMTQTGTIYLWVVEKYFYQPADTSINIVKNAHTEASVSSTFGKQLTFAEVTEYGFLASRSATNFVKLTTLENQVLQAEGESILNGTVRVEDDNVYDLGDPSNRWDDVYATNTTIQTSDRNDKTDISGSDLGLDFINDLRPVKYKWISGSRYHYGLVAQEVSESLASSSIHTDDFAGYIENEIWESGSHEWTIGKINEYGWDTGSFTYSRQSLGLRYAEMISPMIKAIQELSAKVVQLENQISGSE